jgi:hypothetical protein
MVLHGSPRVTRDLDICYSRQHDNLERATRAAGRLKDLADLAEIIEIRKRQAR